MAWPLADQNFANSVVAGFVLCSYLGAILGPTAILNNRQNLTLKTNLVIEVPDHVYVFYEYRLYFSDKDIYMIRYFYHKIEIIRVFINSVDFGMGHTRSTKRYNAILY